MANEEIEEAAFKEYPKMVTDAQGNRVIVKSKDEEKEVTGKSPKKGEAGWGK